MIDDSFIYILNYHNRMFKIKVNGKIMSRGFCATLHNTVRFELYFLLGHDTTSVSDRLPTFRGKVR